MTKTTGLIRFTPVLISSAVKANRFDKRLLPWRLLASHIQPKQMGPQPVVILKVSYAPLIRKQRLPIVM